MEGLSPPDQAPPPPPPPMEDGGPLPGDGASMAMADEMTMPLGEEEYGGSLYDEAQELALIREFGGHPLMQRVQDALLSQLKQTHDRLVEEMRVKKEDLRKTREKREEVGVELYGQQQQLARLQTMLETTHESLTECAKERQDMEEEMARMKDLHESQHRDLEHKQRQLGKNQREHEALTQTLRQVEQYNEEMRNEITITRRATYKVEEVMQDLEKKKKGQDLYIDSLNHQLKHASEQLTLYETQLELQQRQTAEADAVLRETAKDMESLRFEKKQLMLQWQSSLIGLTRRDEAVSAAHEALKDAQTASKDYDTEIDGIKREIIKAQARNETLVSVKDRLESENKYVEEQIAKVAVEHTALAERYQMLAKSKVQTEEEEQKLDKITVTLRQQIEAIVQNVQLVTRERQKLEDEIETNKNAQNTVNKAVRNLNKAKADVVKHIHNKEIEVANVKNELARIQVDKLNTESHVTQLKSTLEKLDEDLKAKDKMIEKYELEIRQRNDEIEKKMYRVDRLNKKYETLLENAEEPENMGPLESTIRHLKKEIDKAENECMDLQKSWLNDQTQLVQLMHKSECQTEKNAELKAKAAILQQQQLRLLQQVKANGDKTKALEAVMVVLHKDMSRMNDLIGRSTNSVSELQNTNFVMEKEFVEELKTLESESVEAERKLLEVKAQKAQVLDQIMETERQAMLWEKKIELERETQAALDPEAGMAECRAMEKEIHRMKIRLDALRREQERLILEMERCIYKHETIALRNRDKTPTVGKTAKKTAPEYSNIGLRKKVSTLKYGLHDATQESANYSFNIEQTQNRLQALTGELEAETSRYGDLEKTSSSLQQEINNLLYEKQRQAESLSRKQLLIRQYQELERGAIAPVKAMAKGEVEKANHEAMKRVNDLYKVLNSARNEFPHLEEVLSRMTQLANDVRVVE